MKLKTLLTTAVTTVLGAAIILPAHATDGTITFAGLVTATTCAINVDGGGASATVNLQAARLSSLSTIGATAGATDFNVVLSGCTGATLNQGVAVNFESGSTVNTNGRLNATGTASGIDLAIYEQGSNNALTLGRAPQASIANITGAAATLAYTVRYHSTTESPRAGTVRSTVNYSIAYF